MSDIGFGPGTPPGEDEGFVVACKVNNRLPKVWLKHLVGGVVTWTEFAGEQYPQIQSTNAWGDATPFPLGTVPAGKTVLSVEIVVTEAFDGTGAALTVGDAGDPDGLMPADQVDPAALGTYSAAPGVTYGSDTVVRLSITPGAGATTGEVLVSITYEL